MKGKWKFMTRWAGLFSIVENSSFRQHVSTVPHWDPISFLFSLRYAAHETAYVYVRAQAIVFPAMGVAKRIWRDGVGMGEEGNMGAKFEGRCKEQLLRITDEKRKAVKSLSSNVRSRCQANCDGLCVRG